MKKKRAIKLMMALGYSRDEANELLRSKQIGSSNLRVFALVLVAKTLGIPVHALMELFPDE